MKQILFVLIFLINNISMAFVYEMETHAKRNIIKSIPISLNKKYIIFTLEGTWSDNLGNYGLMEQASTLILQDNNVIELDGYGKQIYQNKEETYFRGFRNRQEKDAGVGQTIITNTTDVLKALVGTKCTYAVKFFTDTAYVLSKCKISEQQKNILINLSR